MALLLIASVALAERATPTTAVAIGSLDRKGISAPAHYILQSTVMEQLKSRGVPTEDAARAPYVYLARVGTEIRDGKCVYRVVATLIPNTVLIAGGTERPTLWNRDFTSEPLPCDGVSTAMTRTLDDFANAFASDSAAGKVRAPVPVATQPAAP